MAETDTPAETPALRYPRNWPSFLRGRGQVKTWFLWGRAEA